MSAPAIIVISSHVVRGTVGNRAAAFALEVLGHPVWTVPTVTLPWHPGHRAKAGAGTRIVADDSAFDAMIDDLCGSPWLGEVGGVLSGYLGSAGQAHAVARLVAAVKARRADAIYTLDPVMGDAGSLYVPLSQADAIRDVLMPLADMTTPNAFELDTLTGTEAGSDVRAAARATGVERVIATSSPAGDGRIGNLLVHGETALLASTKRLARAPNGAGDLTAALMLAGALRGDRDELALRRTTASVFQLLQRTVDAGADELVLEREQAVLARPNLELASIAELPRSS